MPSGRVRPRVQPSRRDHQLALWLAVASFAIGPLLPLLGWHRGGDTWWAVLVAGLLACLPLVMSARRPLAVLVAVSVVHAAAALAGIRFTPFVSNGGLAFAAAVLMAAMWLPRRRSLRASVVAVALVAVANLAAMAMHPEHDQDMILPILAVAAWVIGDAVRTRRELSAETRAHSETEAAEHEARLRAEERLRLSRDVHDIVSHSLGLIAVQAGVAGALLDRDGSGEHARTALGVIEQTSRDALEELRAVLRELRDPAGGSPSDPLLSDLPSLVEQVRASGLSVELETRGPAPRTGEPAHVTEYDANETDYPALLQTSVYRVVQESLTNVVKHSGSRRAVVRVHLDPGAVTVRVDDDGPSGQSDRYGPSGQSDRHGPSDRDGQSDRDDQLAAASNATTHAAAEGIGLTAMSERAALFGGWVEAGPAPDGSGWRVVATFPTPTRR